MSLERTGRHHQKSAADVPSAELPSDTSAGKMQAAPWIMESPLSFIFRMHWDREPVDCAVASWTAPVLWRFWLARLHRQSARRPEDWRTPKPGGGSHGSWRGPRL